MIDIRLHYCPANGRPTTFNDALYQSQLPPHARSTASKVGSVYNTTASVYSMQKCIQMMHVWNLYMAFVVFREVLGY